MNVTDIFEANRARLHGVAFRMLGSVAEADDAVQETWLRLSHADTREVANLGGWLTTVVARISLDMLRARAARREQVMEAGPPELPAASDPEREALLADAVGLALLVVLDTLEPAERLAFVLHDLFGVAFDEIAPIVGRSPAAARQLASRARRRVQGAPAARDRAVTHQQAVIERFLAALRAGDVEALIAVLDPHFVATGPGVERTGDLQDARAWAARAIQNARGARAARLALVDGAVGLVVAPRGKLLRALLFEVAGDRVSRVDVLAAPEQLAALQIAVLE
ncbi:MAG TPA: sigma-70 family RNA polymerase sigma factor [Polyangia bacterium]|nr:sigma-70 family RNA polymerase sigma factor [Polyangia bacterium]